MKETSKCCSAKALAETITRSIDSNGNMQREYSDEIFCAAEHPDGWGGWTPSFGTCSECNKISEFLYNGESSGVTFPNVAKKKHDIALFTEMLNRISLDKEKNKQQGDING